MFSVSLLASASYANLPRNCEIYGPDGKRLGAEIAESIIITTGDPMTLLEATKLGFTVGLIFAGTAATLGVPMVLGTYLVFPGFLSARDIMHLFGYGTLYATVGITGMTAMVDAFYVLGQVLSYFGPHTPQQKKITVPEGYTMVCRS